ncbi:MAG: endonuclease/exonuclease/phosphatase family protein [Planctomycetota bacterium]
MRLPVAIVVVLLVIAVLPWLGALAWWLDMLNHFRPQLAAGALVVALGVTVWVRRPWAVVGVLAPVSLIGPALPVMFGRGSTSTANRVVHVNVGGCKPAEVSSWLETVDADAAFLLEVRPESPLATTPPAGWRFALQRPSPDTRGLIVLVPEATMHLAMVQSFTVPGTTRDMAVVHLRRGPVMQVHLARPGTSVGFAEQRAMSAAVAEWVEMQEQRVVLVGDFNAAPWSAAVAPLRDAGLRPAAGSIAGTWPASFPPGLRVPIDHAFGNSSGTTVTIGPDLGGDHRPILVDIGE